MTWSDEWKKSIERAPRLLLHADLAPIQGDRFQPTGFADLGAAVYTRPRDGARMLLVESAQSVANRLERAALADDGVHLHNDLKGLPYVVVELKGQGEGVRTSSLVEAHRLNSPFIIANTDFKAEFARRSGYKKGQVISWQKAAAAVFHFDPCALLHGVFFANVEDGRLRFPRLLTGFIEAEHIAEAASGGVKNNHFDPKGEIRAEGHDKDVYGNVPYSRLEFTAKRIRASFNLDLALLRGYGLPEPARALLVALSLYKIRRFLDEGLRLRTACDLQVEGGIVIDNPAGLTVPPLAEITAALERAIAEVRKQADLVRPEVLRLSTQTVRKAKKDEKADGDDGKEAEA